MGSRRPKSAILAVFGGLEIGLRCAGYAGWVCIRSIYDLRRSPGYSLSPQKSVKRIFRGQGLAESGFRVRHDAGVFRPNRRHEQKRNGEKTLKPRSFGVWGGRTKKVVATSLNQRPAKCAIPQERFRKREDRRVCPRYRNPRAPRLGGIRHPRCRSRPARGARRLPGGACARRRPDLDA